MSTAKIPALELAAEHPPSDLKIDADVGEFRIELRGDRQKGSLSLSAPEGTTLHIIIDKGTLKLEYGGPRLQVSAPDAAIEFSAQSIELRAEDNVCVHAGREVDIHSGVDVEVRADHHVNLWGHNVLIGD